MFFSCKENIKLFKNLLNNNTDVVDKTFVIENKEVSVIYVKSVINDRNLSEIILSPLLLCKIPNISTQIIVNQIVSTADAEVVEYSKNSKSKIISGILEGKVAIFVDGEKSCALADVEEIPTRPPSEPPTAAVLYGPRVGFTESVKKNIGMLRKRLPTENLILKEFEIGTYTKTKVYLTYLKGIANLRIIKEISKKLQDIKIDGIIDTHYILSFLQKDEMSFFKQAGLAEKPDVIAGKMLEGRIAILIEGSPTALTIPFVIFEDIQNANDYYTNPIYTSFIRFIRIIGILVATIVPGIYLSLRLYHYNILPLRFLITISNSTDGLPFTPFIELIFILILFQILYEVSLRLPRYLGLATSIVGALILGDTGVSAGLISPPGVIIIAMSIISIYIVPDQMSQLTLLRTIFLFLGGTIGILGIVGAMIYFTNEMSTLQRYGVPYLAPYAPRIKSDLKDGIFMHPLSKMYFRPKTLNNKNERRIDK